MKIHLCLVSDQPLPNLIPLNMEEFRPDKVIFLVSADRKVQAKRLQDILASWKIATESFPIEPYDFKAAQEACLGVLARLEGEEVTLNITGGTKVMALAVYEFFRDHFQEAPVIYVNTQDKKVQRLLPDFVNFAFTGVIKIRPYLSAYGQEVTDHVRPEVIAHKPVFETLAGEWRYYEKAVGVLNSYAAPLRNQKISPCEATLEPRHMDFPDFRDLLNLLMEYGLIALEGNRVRFSNVEFVSGGWLEEYAFNAASSLSPTDIMMGVKVKGDRRSGRTVTNEYDVVFTRGNRLFLMECKTGKLEEEETKVNPVYKLDSLKNAAGGLYGQGMLVSWRKIPPAWKKRLDEDHLKFCEGPDLKNLKEKIRQWMK